MWFVTILDAGHMVPYDEPELALWLVERWISARTDWDVFSKDLGGTAH